MTNFMTSHTMIRKIATKLLLSLTLLLAATGVKAQTANNAYIFYNANYGYLINNGGNPGVSTTFNKNAIWVANNTMGNTSRNVHSYTDDSKYFTGSAGTSNNNNGTFSLGGSNNNWQIINNYLNRANANRGYVRYNGTGFIVNSTNDAQNFTGLAITINQSTPVNPTISITSVAGLSNGGIQLTGNVTGSYTPTYYYASVRNYNNNNTQTYYWTTTTDATTTQPSGITDWSDATKTWAVTTGGAYASVSSDGLVTITGNPTGNVVVTLTVSKGGYTGTQTFTLTRAAVAQSTNTETTINSFSLSPSSAALYVSESQAFTASATVNTTTYNTPAHTSLTNGGNTYRYYNGTLYTNTEDFSATSTTTATPTFTWSKTGDDGNNASLSATTGANTTVTHSTGVTADKALTLTVEASYTGATTQTKTAQVTLYAPFVAPTITRSGNNVILSTTSLGTTIYYTTDGSTPSASNGTAYTGPFSIEQLTLPVTVRAIAIRNGESTPIAQETYSNLSLETPVINISSAGDVTITSSTAGASIRYTTDGTDPTSSSGTVYSGSFNVSNLTTVKAIAYKDGYDNSGIATQQYITSGVNGGTVILNDYEDHNWSYYQPASELPTGYPDQLHSPYPRNVKITYYGNGTNTVATSNNADPGDTFTASTNNSVKVGIDAPENTFVYYKTLERDANNRFPYELIPNPFSVRPTYGSGDTRWRGFYRWRIKSITNGAVYAASTGGTALGVGSMLDAETTYYFQPTDNAQTNANNATSMEIELEALWARAYVGSGYQASVGYERNFVIGGAAVNYPATYSAIYPNGTTNGTTAATTVTGTYDPGNGGRTLSYDTKFEYINLTGNRTYTANNHYLCFGRGISTANNAGTVQGINGNVTDLNYTLRVESGQFSAFSIVRSSGATVSGRYMVRTTLGCDYGRATSTNNNLSISAGSSLFFSQSVTFSSNTNKDVQTFEGVVKSGSIQRNYWDGTGNAEYQQTFYCGQNSSGNTYPGFRHLTIEGGEMGSVCGGRGVGGTSTTYMTPDVLTFYLRIKGGIIHGSVYGGAADNPSIGSRKFVITGGEVHGWIAGGCNGTGGTTGTGATDGNSYIYVGGNVMVGGSNPTTVNGTAGGQVFGAGRGISTRLSSVNYSNVVVADEATVSNASSGAG